MSVNFNSVRTEGGYFTITDAAGKAQLVDLGTLMMMIQLDRTKALDNQIADMLGEINNRNAEIKALTDMMAVCRKLRTEHAQTGTVSVGYEDYKQSLLSKNANALTQGYILVERDIGGGQILFQISRPEWETKIAADPTIMSDADRLKAAGISLNTTGYLPATGTQTITIESAFALHGLEWSTIPKYDKDKPDAFNNAWEANIQTLKGKVDNLNNDSQMSNIRLQNLLEKRGNAFEAATKVMDTNNQSIQSILRNL